MIGVVAPAIELAAPDRARVIRAGRDVRPSFLGADAHRDGLIFGRVDAELTPVVLAPAPQLAVAARAADVSLAGGDDPILFVALEAVADESGAARAGECAGDVRALRIRVARVACALIAVDAA